MGHDMLLSRVLELFHGPPDSLLTDVYVCRSSPADANVQEVQVVAFTTHFLLHLAFANPELNWNAGICSLLAVRFFRLPRSHKLFKQKWCLFLHFPPFLLLITFGCTNVFQISGKYRRYCNLLINYAFFFFHLRLMLKVNFLSRNMFWGF